MSLEANKDLIRRYFAAIDAACQSGNADILDEFLAPDFVEHNPFPGIPPTRDGWKQAFFMFDVATPGYHVVEDVLAEGDKVVARITAHGTHEGELFGIPATGKSMTLKVCDVYDIEDGKVKSQRTYLDTGSMMAQLGLLPEQTATATQQ